VRRTERGCTREQNSNEGYPAHRHIVFPLGLRVILKRDFPEADFMGVCF